ncbi:hypothetical protein [Selenomonas ruminantium]|uniref:hypothetical protein n=1 Tax=Selenomonas ruminantium TaxID=971 RepID=UPI00131597E9|nr:hypothetical protein [Selenomonas ruminantium]
MTKNEARKEVMIHAMDAIKYICEQEHGKGGKDCPANGEGELCHSGEISCCAPYRWWGFKGLGRGAGND